MGNNQITNIACRRLAITEKSDLTLMAWAQQARNLARDIDTYSINIKGLLAIIPVEQRQRSINKASAVTLLKLSRALSCSMEELIEYQDID